MQPFHTFAISEDLLPACLADRISLISGKDGKSMIALRLGLEDLLQFLQLLRILVGKVVRLAIILVQVV